MSHRTIRTRRRLTEIFDRWAHLRHSDDICDSSFSRDDAVRSPLGQSRRQWTSSSYSPSKSIGILFTKLLEEHDTKLGKQSILATLLDDHGELARQISCLLTNLGRLVVETPKDSGNNLGEVRLDADAYIRHKSARADMENVQSTHLEH